MAVMMPSLLVCEHPDSDALTTSTLPGTITTKEKPDV
jgi:hypothetical protein